MYPETKTTSQAGYDGAPRASRRVSSVITSLSFPIKPCDRDFSGGHGKPAVALGAP